jgi:oligopeptide/dipeptide ABC transporter ATP-binding protein
MITHDLGVIAEMAKRVVVMYAGRVMERASVADIFHHPRHPYTIGLQASIPRVIHKDKKLDVIPGRVPDPFHYPTGCRFSDRCRFAEERCRKEEIDMRVATERHSVRCWKDVGMGEG